MYTTQISFDQRNIYFMREMPEAEKRQTRRMQNKNEFLSNVCVMFCVVDFVKVV